MASVLRLAKRLLAPKPFLKRPGHPKPAVRAVDKRDFARRRAAPSIATRPQPKAEAAQEKARFETRNASLGKESSTHQTPKTGAQFMLKKPTPKPELSQETPKKRTSKPKKLSREDSVKPSETSKKPSESSKKVAKTSPNPSEKNSELSEDVLDPSQKVDESLETLDDPRDERNEPREDLEKSRRTKKPANLVFRTPDEAKTDLLEGVVMKSGGGKYHVDIPEEAAPRVAIVCELGGRLKKGKRDFSQPVSVGDRVRVRPLETSGGNVRGDISRDGFIEELLPRTSQLGRARYNKTAQVTVANLDQVVVVMAAREPDLNAHRLDRFLILAEANALRSVICLNKVDLLSKKEIKKTIEPLAKIYEDLGYPVVLTSALPEEDNGRKTLEKELRGHISAFIGSSGVGKSSLVMMIEPDLQLWIGDVMDIGKGRHTTTDVSLHPLSKGGYIADTPGVKTVALLEQQEVELDECFPEMRERAAKCRFNDCTHRSEPDCAIRAALDKGKIAPSRYESYLRLWEEIGAKKPTYPKKTPRSS